MNEPLKENNSSFKIQLADFFQLKIRKRFVLQASL